MAIGSYHNDPEFSDRQALENSVDLDQTSLKKQCDQGLHCLPFRLHFFDTLFYGKTTSVKFYDNNGNFFGVRSVLIFAVPPFLHQDLF